MLDTVMNKIYLCVSDLDDLNIARERLMTKEEEMAKTVGKCIVLPWFKWDKVIVLLHRLKCEIRKEFSASVTSIPSCHTLSHIHVVNSVQLVSVMLTNVLHGMLKVHV